MKLSPRLWELVELVGGKGYSYGRAARAMGLSYRTVQEYAAEVRARAGLPMNPQAALHVLYREHRATEKPKRRARRAALEATT